MDRFRNTVSGRFTTDISLKSIQDVDMSLEITLLLSATRFPQEHYCTEGDQASPICLSGNSIM